MRSLGETVKQGLVPWDGAARLYKQLVTLYGATGIDHKLAVYAAFVLTPVANTDTDLARLEADVPRRRANFNRMMQSLGNDVIALQKLTMLASLPAALQRPVVRHLLTRYASVRDLPNFPGLFTFIQAYTLSDKPQVNTATPTAPPGKRSARPPPTGPC